MTENKLYVEFPLIEPMLPDEVFFIHVEDLLLWNPVLESAFEISSMGIRVDEVALREQLELRGETHKSELMYHKLLLEGKLPYTIGGGIGQSRLCMFLLRKAHIGEIQSSVWSEETRIKCQEAGIDLV